MHRKPILVCLVVSACLGAKEPSTQPDSQTVAVQVQGILEVPRAESDHLEELAAVMSVPTGKREQFDEAVATLVRRLNEPASPSAFSDLLISKVTIDDVYGHQERADWRYGTFTDRARLSEYIWQKSQKLAETAPAQAGAWAKAALLLGAYEDFTFGNIMVRARYQQPEEFNRIAGLTQEQAEQLSKLVTELTQTRRRYSQKFRAIARLEGELIASKGALPRDQFGKELSALKEAFAITSASPTQIGNLYSVIFDAWMLRNLARARGDEQAMREVDELLKSWEAKLPSDPARRWVREALSKSGEPPAVSRIVEVDEKGRPKRPK